MSRSLLAAALCVCALAAAAARSPPQTFIQQAVNKTLLCPFKVHIDTNEARTPKYIAKITCDEPAIAECPVKNPDNCCYKRNPNGESVHECHQLEQWITVKYGQEESVIKWQVGCACVAEPVVEAREIS